ncbi:MAG: trehalose-6-phosphate synthase [Acidobacteria bacterium]|nr:trehalose-6-phosphate synthase [Acidobacteriota bacterium]
MREYAQGAMFSRNQIEEFIQSTLANCRFVVVSNREPYVHSYAAGGEIECSRPTSGMVSALDPVLQASSGTWIAHASGSADGAVVDRQGRVLVPPESPRYYLQRVWLTPEQVENYYQGFSNQGLWPLCHMAHTQPRFYRRHWEDYQRVNELFAKEVYRAVGNEPALVFVQDYHFALLPRLIKQLCPQAIVAHFWHIPWPAPEVLEMCPWQREILSGMLASDLIGFHLPEYCHNFTAAATRLFTETRIKQRNTSFSRECARKVRAFPISVDFEEINSLAASERVAQRVQELRRIWKLPKWVGLGIDRLDYIKGIPERLRAVARFLELYPQYRGQFTFIQVAVPSRTEIPEYQELRRTVSGLADEINARFGGDGWEPIKLIMASLPMAEVTALYRLGDFCLISSLHDGMNLVAQEYVAARCDKQGALLLSRFAGASGLLRDALLIDPYHTEEMAHQIRRALELKPAEARRRMRRMRFRLRRRNIFQWMADLLTASVECGAEAPAEGAEAYPAVALY